MTMTKTADGIVCDLTGTGPQARGPINHAGDYADGLFLRKWMACILRNLAESAERAAQLDINEGICEVLELRFPPPGTLVTPRFPAPTNARSFLILRLLGVFAGCLAQAVGGRMPADQETIRYWGIHGTDAGGRWYLLREVLGGGSGGRFYADGSDAIHIVPDSKNLPAEFAETRFPVLIEKLALAIDSGGAGMRRGGTGDHKHRRRPSGTTESWSARDGSWSSGGRSATAPSSTAALATPPCAVLRVFFDSRRGPPLAFSSLAGGEGLRK